MSSESPPPGGPPDIADERTIRVAVEALAARLGPAAAQAPGPPASTTTTARETPTVVTRVSRTPATPDVDVWNGAGAPPAKMVSPAPEPVGGDAPTRRNPRNPSTSAPAAETRTPDGIGRMASPAEVHGEFPSPRGEATKGRGAILWIGGIAVLALGAFGLGQCQPDMARWIAGKPSSTGPVSTAEIGKAASTPSASTAAGSTAPGAATPTGTVTPQGEGASPSSTGPAASTTAPSVPATTPTASPPTTATAPSAPQSGATGPGAAVPGGAGTPPSSVPPVTDSGFPPPAAEPPEVTSAEMRPPRGAATPGAAAGAEQAAAAKPVLAPSFDIARVGPDGRAVIAGRGEPGARVVLLDGDKEIATVEIDSRGEWVALVNDPPLAPGAHELRLVLRKDGAELARADRTVAIVVPKAEPGAAPPLVVSTPVAGGPSAVLQAPGGRDALARSGDLVLGAVDYDGQGRATISGQAAPGAAVRVYLGDKPVGEAVAGADGKWELRPAEALPLGRQALRVDRIGPGGAVASRLEVPFSRIDLPGGGGVTIVRGDNLWNIARARLGDGPRYTAIYAANRDQIRDPDLIYPGQVFVIPKAP